MVPRDWIPGLHRDFIRPYIVQFPIVLSSSKLIDVKYQISVAQLYNQIIFTRKEIDFDIFPKKIELIKIFLFKILNKNKNEKNFCLHCNPLSIHIDDL